MYSISATIARVTGALEYGSKRTAARKSTFANCGNGIRNGYFLQTVSRFENSVRNTSLADFNIRF